MTDMTGRQRTARLLGPARLAFVGSLLLSWLAVYFEPVLGRDASFYVDNARVYLEQGMEALLAEFSWPWFSALIGLTHQFTGLALITSAYVWIFLFTAGTCALLVRCTELIRPDAGYYAVLAVLTMPAYNEYRHQILREPGFWFFSALALLCMTRFMQSQRWPWVSAAAMAVLLAAVFRLEAIYLLVVILLTLVWKGRAQLTGRGRTGPVVLLALALMTGVVVWLVEQTADLERVSYYSALVSIEGVVSGLNRLVNDFATSSLHEYSYADAGYILVLGFVATVMFKAVLMMGPIAVALVAGASRAELAGFCRRYVFGLVAMLLYLAILLVFFIQHRFMVDRYISFLALLAVPLVAILLREMHGRYRRFFLVVMVAAILMGLANVVSLSSKRTHYLSAAQWVKDNVEQDEKVFFYDPRISFYSDMGYRKPEFDSTGALGEGFAGFTYFLVDLPVEHPLVQERLASGTLQHLASFDNGDNRALIILGKPRTAPALTLPSH